MLLLGMFALAVGTFAVLVGFVWVCDRV